MVTRLGHVEARLGQIWVKSKVKQGLLKPNKLTNGTLTKI
jgi:hypothetical protein